MFRGYFAILLLAAGFAQDQHSVNNRPVGGVSIPVELTSTIRAERVHRGDPVEFRTLQSVLVSSGVVMPANAKLTGRIVGAAPRQGDKPSWLVLLVERGEWKNQSIPLHAFIAAQIRISPVPFQAQQSSDSGSTTVNARRAGRESGRVAAQDGIDISSTTRLPQDSGSPVRPSFVDQSATLKDLRIVRDENGITFLFSVHDNVKLPSGTLFRLQDESPPVSPGAGTSAKPENMFPSQP